MDSHVVKKLMTLYELNGRPLSENARLTAIEMLDRYEPTSIEKAIDWMHVNHKGKITLHAIVETAQNFRPKPVDNGPKYISYWDRPKHERDEIDKARNECMRVVRSLTDSMTLPWERDKRNPPGDW